MHDGKNIDKMHPQYTKVYKFIEASRYETKCIGIVAEGRLLCLLTPMGNKREV